MASIIDRVNEENRTEAPAYLPSLDGWRAISILIVLGAHAAMSPGFPPSLVSAFNWIFDGTMGVRIFFVISGLLITWLLLVETRKYGSVCLRFFYARRILRIFPVYFAFLAVLAALQFGGRYYQGSVAWIANLTFTTNYFVAQAGATAHLWSLAVEEQFYLVWPVAFVLFGVGTGFLRGWCLILSAIVAGPVFRVICYVWKGPAEIAPLFSWGATFRFFDSIAIGCGCALLLFHRKHRLEKWILSRESIVGIMAFALIAVPHVLVHYRILGFITVPLHNTIQAVGFGVLILQSVMRPSRWIYRILNKRVVCQIGVWSYSIYIWHMIAFQTSCFDGATSTWWRVFPGWMATGVAVGVVSYYCLEMPFFRLRARFRTH